MNGNINEMSALALLHQAKVLEEKNMALTADANKLKQVEEKIISLSKFYELKDEVDPKEYIVCSEVQKVLFKLMCIVEGDIKSDN